ncbi:hypothetical protein Tco_0848451 [Tanacetum coccineum]
MVGTDDEFSDSSEPDPNNRYRVRVPYTTMRNIYIKSVRPFTEIPAICYCPGYNYASGSLSFTFSNKLDLLGILKVEGDEAENTSFTLVEFDASKCSWKANTKVN